MTFAIFPGSFNPIHLGHLMIADSAAKQYSLKKVSFVVSPYPPNKKNSRDFLKYEKRVELLNAAISENHIFSLDTRESKREGLSYTIDTVSEIINEKKIDSKLNFIIGVDAFLTLPSWHRAEELGEKCRFLIACRPGWQSVDVEDSLSVFHDQLDWDIIDSPLLSISSTQIRLRKKGNKAYRYLLMPEVYSLYKDIN
ncbi:MAG: nicotinate (nicotinamide) nucleotide adenylyltransferase [Candidatus Caenarcaniphilales bacterium]|nr:nicotinate (nicotinamide) nucleotide adenylyltransferase [Candidatus Caenarcaniphilales bacterium]